MTTLPYDQRLARILVRPLARLAITPNQVTTATPVLALARAPVSWASASARRPVSVRRRCFGLGLDRASKPEAPASGGYPALAGFELEDGIYLIAPVTWLGLLPYFLVAAGLGAAI